MTGKAYVAIRCSKARVLYIVRGSFSLSFIKGIHRNLHLKISAFSKHFHFKGYGSSLSVKPTLFKGTCPLECKCLLNAEIFKCKFGHIPLKKLSENGPRTILKERSFQQCIAN